MQYITVWDNDDTDSFGHHLAKVKLKNAENYTIPKAIFECGPEQIIINNPVFPFFVDFTSEEVSRLYSSNKCFLILYDAENKQRTIQLGMIVEKKKRGA